MFGHRTIQQLPHLDRIMPAFIVLFPRHGYHNLLRPTLGLPRSTGTVTIYQPGSLRSVHAHSSS
jgi:hypothetical protein